MADGLHPLPLASWLTFPGARRTAGERAGTGAATDPLATTQPTTPSSGPRAATKGRDERSAGRRPTATCVAADVDAGWQPLPERSVAPAVVFAARPPSPSSSSSTSTARRLGPAADHERRHVPVLLERTALLAPALSPGASGRRHLGLGGHSAAARAHPRCAWSAWTATRRLAPAGRLAPYADRTTLVHAVYDELPEVLARLGLGRVAGRPVRPRRLLAAARRGRPRLRLRPGRAAGHADGPDRAASPPPRSLNTYPAAELARVLRGVRRGAVRPADRRARSSASASRSRSPTSARLVELVRDAIPAATRRTGGNPAKRTFQALRIEVNGELGVARSGRCPAAIDALAVGGRIVVMSYQSLEDRIVKRALAAGATTTTPRRTCPCVPEHCSRGCGCSPAGPRSADRGRGRRATRGRRRCGCAPPSASGRRHERRRHRRARPRPAPRRAPAPRSAGRRAASAAPEGTARGAVRPADRGHCSLALGLIGPAGPEHGRSPRTRSCCRLAAAAATTSSP